MKSLNKKVINEMGFISKLDTSKTKPKTEPQLAGVYKVDPKRLRKDMIRILHEKQVLRDTGVYPKSNTSVGPSQNIETKPSVSKPSVYEYKKSSDFVEGIEGLALLATPFAAIVVATAAPITIPIAIVSFIIYKCCKSKEPEPKVDTEPLWPDIDPAPTPVVKMIPPPVIPTFEYRGMQIPEYKDIRGTPLWYEYRSSIITSRGTMCNRFDPTICPKFPLRLHHIIRVKNGGSNRPENLEVICKAHHAIEHPWAINKLRI